MANTAETFLNSMLSCETLTENGAPSLSSTQNECVDLFFKTVRKIDKELLFNYMKKSWNTCQVDTLKIMLYVRDCEKGKGERLIFYQMVQWLWNNGNQTLVCEFMKLLTDHHFGYWKDLLNILVIISDDYDDQKIFQNSDVYQTVVILFANQLFTDISNMKENKPITFCAKYAPSKNGSHDKKLKIVNKIARYLSNKHEYETVYRKTLHAMREYLNIAEIKFSENKWNELEFAKLPSMCLHRNTKSFMNHCEDRWSSYLENVKSGKETMKVKMVYPYEILQTYIENNITNEDSAIELAWKQKINDIKKENKLTKRILPICDVSGSMFGDKAILNSVSLGLLISDTNESVYKNHVITFSDQPSLVNVSGETVLNRVNALKNIDWGMNTDFIAVFNMLLNHMKKCELPQSEAPEVLLCISDMQFDQSCHRYCQWMTNYQIVENLYKNTGYRVPQIWFWNVRANTVDFPVDSNAPNVALVSGFSSSVLNMIMEGNELSPYKLMRQTIDNDRYNCVEKLI